MWAEVYACGRDRVLPRMDVVMHTINIDKQAWCRQILHAHTWFDH
jgi:hypothetical protein